MPMWPYSHDSAASGNLALVPYLYFLMLKNTITVNVLTEQIFFKYVILKGLLSAEYNLY